MSPCHATTGMPSVTPCREPLLMVIVEKRLSVSRAITSAAMRSGGSVCWKASWSASAAFCLLSSMFSRLVWSICSRRGVGVGELFARFRGAGGWSPPCRRTSRDTGDAFLEEPRHREPDFLGLDHDRAVGQQEAQRGKQGPGWRAWRPFGVGRRSPRKAPAWIRSSR